MNIARPAKVKEGSSKAGEQCKHKRVRVLCGANRCAFVLQFGRMMIG